MTNERHTIAFGIENSVLPLNLSVHGAMSSASDFPTSAVRVPAT